MGPRRAFNVVIKGEAPLLMHAPTNMGKSASKTGVIPSPEDEAKAGLYLDAKGNIVVPARCVEGALVKAASALKAPGRGKKTLKDFILAGLVVDPFEIPLTSPGYVVDTQRARIQRAGVLRSRPRFDEWSLAFQVILTDEYLLGMDAKIREIIEEAGQHVGILDFRPRYGRFQVESFEVVNG
jgi:hypothetical protein